MTLDPRHTLESLVPSPRRLLRVLALDPGETVGVAVFDGPNCVMLAQAPVLANEAGELQAGPLINELRRIICKWDPKVIVCEEYRVYRWKAKQHVQSDLFTPRLIGGIEYVCDELKKPLIKQTAHIAKTFVTDDKLKVWGLYTPSAGKKHARDAIRHAIYFLIFGPSKKQGIKLNHEKV